MNITIETLWKKGHNKSEISRLTGHDWKTVFKVIKQIERSGAYPKKKPHPRKLDAYKSKIQEFLEQDLSGVRIFEELKAVGVKVGYSTVKEYILDFKKRENICIRFHTKPGEEGQVDFGYVGLTLDNCGKRRKTWIFNMRLSYSRLDYYEKVYDQKVETFIKCHINAFKYFGGVPEYIKIDNLKAAILEANFYEPIYQGLYKQFANYYGFHPIPCRVRQPQEKGKVESGIKYVKNNFFSGRKFKDSDDLDSQLKDWLENTCNARVHGTTRKVPREVFNQVEKVRLSKLPITDFRMPKVGTRLVYNDWHVYIDYSYYSVPAEYIGKEVEIEIDDRIVKIFYETKQIALHTKSQGKGEFVTEKSHCPKFKDYLSTEYQERYQVKMNKIGTYAGQLFLLIVNQKPREWNRTVSGILSLSKKFPKEIVNLACERALAFNVTQYRIIKNICQNGTYKLPIDTEFYHEYVEE